MINKKHRFDECLGLFRDKTIWVLIQPVSSLSAVQENEIVTFPPERQKTQIQLIQDTA